jgi:hypothetical protein
MSPFSSGGGQFGLLGGMMLPVMLLVALLKAPPGPVRRLIQAGAVSPETALKPATAKIARPAELAGARRKGIVVTLPDGRCWVDVPRFRRRRVIGAILLVVAIAVIGEAIWLGVQMLRG